MAFIHRYSKYYLILMIVFTMIIGIGSIFSAIFSLYNRPTQKENPIECFVEVKKGDVFGQIVETLYEKKMIRSVFWAKVLWWQKNYQLKKGYYRFTSDMKMSEILSILDKGKEYLFKITIPEGLITKEIKEILKESGFEHIAEEWEATLSQSDFLQKYRIPFSHAEGFLFPSTYYIAKNITGKELAEKMVETFYQKVGQDWNSLSDEQKKKIIILASLIEREAKEDSEKPLIASVLYNRLKKDMKLEVDATVVYIFKTKGIEKKRVFFKDLEIDSPYNTYKYKGIPPGPICNPGYASIKAALNPEKSDYYYYLYQGEGKHIFSKTYEEHQVNYKKYILPLSKGNKP